MDNCQIITVSCGCELSSLLLFLWFLYSWWSRVGVTVFPVMFFSYLHLVPLNIVSYALFRAFNKDSDSNNAVS